MTTISGSTAATRSTARSTNHCISVAAERLLAMSAGGSASTMSGPRRAAAAASSGESAQTNVASPTSLALRMAPAMSVSVMRRSEWLSIVPTAPASAIASASTAPAPRPGVTGSMCWAKTWMSRVARATVTMSTAWGSKTMATSSASASRSAAWASRTAAAP
jgi:hypothetical protein